MFKTRQGIQIAYLCFIALLKTNRCRIIFVLITSFLTEKM